MKKLNPTYLCLCVCVFMDVCMFLPASSLRFSQRSIMNATYIFAQGDGERFYGNENSLLLHVLLSTFCFSWQRLTRCSSSPRFKP